MANAISVEYAAKTAFTLTLGSLASDAARQSTIIDNTTLEHLGAKIYLKVKSGGSAPGNQLIRVYFIADNGDGTYRSDDAGASDAAITVRNARPLGIIRADNQTNFTYFGEFDTNVLGPLPPKWGIILLNELDNALNASGHLAEFATYFLQVN